MDIWNSLLVCYIEQGDYTPASDIVLQSSNGFAADLMRGEGFVVVDFSIQWRCLCKGTLTTFPHEKEWHLIPEGTPLSPVCKKQTRWSFSQGFSPQRTQPIGMFPFVTIQPLKNSCSLLSSFSLYALLSNIEMMTDSPQSWHDLKCMLKKWECMNKRIQKWEATSSTSSSFSWYLSYSLPSSLLWSFGKVNVRVGP